MVKFFNKSLEPIKCLPFIRKQANVTPIFKGKGSEDVIHNYRPISLTSAICKIMVKIILNTYNFNLENNILIKYQSGFKPNDSTVNQFIGDLQYHYFKSRQRERCQIYFFVIFQRPLTKYDTKVSFLSKNHME